MRDLYTFPSPANYAPNIFDLPILNWNWNSNITN